MTYQVIARKWRPQTFEEVTGQEHITKTLRNAIEHDRIHHSYIFYGTRGVGKTTTARLLAKALNCQKSDKPTSIPCRVTSDACDSCKEITNGRSIDVQEIDAASNTGVESVRENIVRTMDMRAARDRYKIFIIDEVHMLTSQSFNALLKSIEEPPPKLIFILATTEHHKIPETILSRSQQFGFKSISNAKIFERLRLIANAEFLLVTDEALKEIARAGDGSMRDAQSAFDQVISFTGENIDKEDVEMALGVVPSDVLLKLVNGIAGQKPTEIMAVVEELVMNGHDLRNFCRDLLSHFRDLLMAKISDNDELLESAICDKEHIKEQSTLFSESDLIRFFHSLAETESQLQRAAHPRYMVEIGLVKLAEMRRLESMTSLVNRLSSLEQSIKI